MKVIFFTPGRQGAKFFLCFLSGFATLREIVLFSGKPPMKGSYVSL